MIVFVDVEWGFCESVLMIIFVVIFLKIVVLMVN